MLNTKEGMRVTQCSTLVDTRTDKDYLESRLVSECGSQHGTVLNLINDAQAELALVLPGDDANLATLILLLPEKDESKLMTDW